MPDRKSEPRLVDTPAIEAHEPSHELREDDSGFNSARARQQRLATVEDLCSQIRALREIVRSKETMQSQTPSLELDARELPSDDEVDDRDYKANIGVQQTLVTSVHRELTTLLREVRAAAREDMGVIQELAPQISKIIDFGVQFRPAVVQLQEFQARALRVGKQRESALFQEYGVADREEYYDAQSQARETSWNLRKKWFGFGKLIHREKIKSLDDGAVTMRQRYDDVKIDYDLVTLPNLYPDPEYDVNQIAHSIHSAVERRYINKLRAAEGSVDTMLAILRPEDNKVEARVETSVEDMQAIEDSLRDSIIDRNAERLNINPSELEALKQRVSQLARATEGIAFNDYAWNDVDDDERRLHLRERVNELPDWTRLRHRDFGPYIRNQVQALLRMPEALSGQKQLAATINEAKTVERMLEAASNDSSSGLHYQVAKILASSKRVALHEFPWRTWHAMASAPETRQLLGSDVVEQTTHELQLAVRDALRTTPAHTEASNNYVHWLAECDGPEFAEYVILDAWRETGMSGEMPLLGSYTSGSQNLLYRYIQRQSPDAIVTITQANPAIGEVLKVIHDHPDTYTHSMLPDPEALPEEHKYVRNPAYEELQHHLMNAGMDLLSSDDPADQFFALGLLRNLQQPVPQDAYEKMTYLLSSISDLELRKEIIAMAADRTSYQKDRDAMQFLARNFDALIDDEKERMSWSDGELVTQILVAESPDDPIFDVVGKLTGLSPEAVRALPAVYDALGRPGDAHEFRQRPSLQASDTSVMIHLAAHYEDFLRSVTDVRQWMPEMKLSSSMWYKSGGNTLLPANLTAVIFSNRYREEIKEALLAHVTEYGEPPSGVVEAALVDSQLGELTPADAQARITQCLRVAADSALSAEVRNYFYGYGITKTLQLEAAHYEQILERAREIDTAIIKLSNDARKFLGNSQFMGRLLEMDQAEMSPVIRFVQDMDKAFAWTEVGRFITQAEQAGYITITNEDDQRVVAGFMGEFGTAGSIKLYTYYAQLIRGEDVHPDLAELGVKNTGRSGVNELRRVVRTIRRDLVRNDAVEDIEKPLRQEIASTILQFTTSQWSVSGKRVSDIIGQLSIDRAGGLISPLPEAYEVGDKGFHVMQVSKLDAKKIAEFKFTEGFQKRYTQLIDSFKPVREKQDAMQLIAAIKASVTERAETEVEVLTQRIAEFQKEGKPEAATRGVTRARDQYEQLIKRLGQADAVPSVIEALLEHDKKDNDFTTPALRQLLLVHARDVNPGYLGDMHFLDSTEPSRDGAVQMMTYVEDLVLAETLPTLGLSDPSVARAREIFNFRSFNDELQRLEAYAKQGVHEIVCVPSRGVLAEFSGYFSDACWTQQDNIVRDNPDMVGVAFVQNLGDEAHERIIGSCLLFERTSGGEKVLIVRGLNPIQNVVTGLDAGSFVDEFLEYIKPIALKLGATKILAPLDTAGTLTNRPTIDTALRVRFGENKKIQLDEPIIFNGYRYQFNQAVELLDLAA